MSQPTRRIGTVEYSKWIPTLGILAGLALTFAFPIVVLKTFSGQGIGQGAVTGMMIIGVSGGVLITLFSAVFGIALPGRVDPPESDAPRQRDGGGDLCRNPS